MDCNKNVFLQMKNSINKVIYCVSRESVLQLGGKTFSSTAGFLINQK